MELFFMLTAMLALIGPIAAGRVRCIVIAPRLRRLVNAIMPAASADARSLEAVAFAWPHAPLAGKPDWCPKHAWATGTSTARSGKSTNLSHFVRVTAALARIDQIAPNYARRPHY